MTATNGNTDLDETRRLLYMAILRQQTEKYVLAGTLVNALAHHQHAGPPDEIAAHILAVIEQADPDSIEWAHNQIHRITAELEADS